MKRLGHCVFAGALWLAVLSDVSALTANIWTNSVGGKWESGVNWSLAVPPSTNSQSAVVITNVATKTINIDPDTVLSNALNGCMTVSNLFLAGPPGTINTQRVTNAGVVTPLRILDSLTIGSNALLVVTNSMLRVDGLLGGVTVIEGSVSLFSDSQFTAIDVLIGTNLFASGTLRFAGATNEMSHLEVGAGILATGTVWMTGGKLTLTNVIGSDFINVKIGYLGGIGQMTISNGNALLANFECGAFNGGRGTFTMAGGTNSITDNTFFGIASSTGTLWITGGQLLTTNGNSIVDIGTSGTPGVPGTGLAVLSNGEWRARVVSVAAGISSVGTLTIAGGTMLTSGTLTAGNLTNSIMGTVQVFGGQLITTNAPVIIGTNSVGQATITNGIWLAQRFTVAQRSPSATLTVSGGTLAASGPLAIGGANSTGTVWVVGGQLVITNNPALVGDGSGLVVDGSLILSNGTLVVSNLNTIVGNRGSGSLTNLGGTTQFNDLIVGNLTGSRGTITFAGGTNRMTASTSIGLMTASTGTVWITGGFVNPVLGFGFTVGTFGSGRLILSNGTLRSDLITLGATGGSVGTLTVAGGTWDGPGALTAGAAFNAIGTVWITGGTVVLTNNSWDNVIATGGGLGRVTVSNGLVFARQMNLGVGAGVGTFTAAGGTNTVYSGMILGNNVCTATGIVIVAGGRLDVTNSFGTAVLEVRSGTVQLNSGTLTIDNLVVTNVCGHFIKAGGFLSVTSTNLDPNLSAVGDGIPNSWKQQYGFDVFDPTVAGADPDGDDMSNLQEYLAGSNPLADIKSIKREGDDIRVTWQAAASKTNALQRSPGTNGSYSNNFADIFIVTNNTGGVTNSLDLGAATNAPAFYYRVRLVP